MGLCILSILELKAHVIHKNIEKKKLADVNDHKSTYYKVINHMTKKKNQYNRLIIDYKSFKF